MAPRNPWDVDVPVKPSFPALLRHCDYWQCMAVQWGELVQDARDYPRHDRLAATRFAHYLAEYDQAMKRFVAAHLLWKHMILRKHGADKIILDQWEPAA